VRVLAGSLLRLFSVTAFVTACSHSSKTGEMAEFAYATGCYQAHQGVCARLGDEEKSSLCYETALATCEKMGREFRSWVQSKPQVPAEVPAKLE
jgi:hypothetical protein